MAAKRKRTRIAISGIFADRLAEVRGTRSQREVAESVGMDRSAITRIENGDRSVTLEEAIELAAALNVCPTFLITPADPEAKVKVGNKSYTAREVWDWMRGFGPLGYQETAWEDYDRHIPFDERIYEAFTSIRGQQTLIFQRDREHRSGKKKPKGGTE